MSAVIPADDDALARYVCPDTVSAVAVALARVVFPVTVKPPVVDALLSVV